MSKHYWLIQPNGGKQLIDPRFFDLDRLAEQARRNGGKLVLESETVVIEAEVSAKPEVEAGPDPRFSPKTPKVPDRPPRLFEPPISALGPLFRSRLDRIYACIADFEIDMNTRPTTRVLGGYYKSRRLIRIYSHDSELGRRSLEELFDTFLHELAHHIEYTEPDSFHARGCERVPGRMHSRLFWRILGELKGRWADLQKA